MGIHFHKDQNIEKMKVLIFSLLVLVSVQATPEMMKKIMDNINLYNLRSKCWGEGNTNAYAVGIQQATEKCSQLAPSYDLVELITPLNNPFTNIQRATNNPFQKLQTFQDLNELKSLWRTRRAASTGLLQPDEEDFFEFLEDFGEFKESIASKMGNLTCVLQEFKYITPDLKINIEEFTKSLEEIEGFNVEESAGKDPEWAKKLAEGYMDCYKISENWPQASLNRNPLTKVFGRHMIFFKCADKNEKKMCAKAQMLEWLETVYGTNPNNDPSEYGLPTDKYDAAATAIMVLNNAATPEEEFIGDFFWGMGK